MRTPDLTPAQIIALIGSALTLAVSFGVSISGDQRIAVLSFVGAILGLFMHSDAKIRHGRATGTVPKPLAGTPEAPHAPPADSAG